MTNWNGMEWKKGAWHKWFAWFPVKLCGKSQWWYRWRWLTTVYRRELLTRSDMEIYSLWIYGDLFDVLRYE